MPYCQALCCYIIEPWTSYTRRQFRLWSSITVADRRGVRVISIQSRKRVTAYSRISRKRSFDIWIHAFHPSARGKRIASILGPDFAALAPRRVKNGENKADKGSINGEMGICEWRDYGIIENWIFFFFFSKFWSVHNLFIENLAFDVWLKILYRKYSTMKLYIYIKSSVWCHGYYFL